jgi:glycosyltransferase involved in cell wall biosynthesis
MLQRLLRRLQAQRTSGRFDYSILVVDNDSSLSAADAVSKIAIESLVPIKYCGAPHKNIALARNVAVTSADGELIAFIDDDETPIDEWLLNLFLVYRSTGADGVLGPVRPVYEEVPPQWVLRAKLFDRPSYPTGTVLDWNMTRTGNVLLRRSIFDDPANLFDPSFKHSEDKEFFKRMTEQKLTFVWCAEAVVYETEPADRFRRTYFVRRALIRGNASMRQMHFSAAAIMKSLIAVVVYASLLPFLHIGGHHLFMRYLIKLCDHVGGLVAVLGIDLARRFTA